MTVSSENKALAKYIRTVFGGVASVNKYWDDSHHSDIDIFRAAGAPAEGVDTFCTLGLSDHDIELVLDNNKPLRAEVLIAAQDQFEFAANVLSTCAFNVINSETALGPSVVYPDVVAMYAPELTVRHVMFVAPFLYPLETQWLETKTVAWLLAIPITEAEQRFHAQYGAEALEARLEDAEVDIFDLARASII
jgi:hypothetical protein